MDSNIVFRAETKNKKYSIEVKDLSGLFMMVEHTNGRYSGGANWDGRESARRNLLENLKNAAADKINYVASVNLLIPEIGIGLKG